MQQRVANRREMHSLSAADPMSPRGISSWLIHRRIQTALLRVRIGCAGGMSAWKKHFCPSKDRENPVSRRDSDGIRNIDSLDMRL